MPQAWRAFVVVAARQLRFLQQILLSFLPFIPGGNCWTAEWTPRGRATPQPPRQKAQHRRGKPLPSQSRPATPRLHAGAQAGGEEED